MRSTLFAITGCALLLVPPALVLADQNQPQTKRTDAAPAAAKRADAAGQARPAEDDYRLGAGDKLRVEVYKDQQLSQSLQIRPDGKITLPLIGDVRAAGLTPIELREAITSSLKEYVTNPVVSVIVVETVASQVFVMGEVNRPGSIPLPGALTVLQALAMAGGFKDFANTKDIRVLRRGPSGPETIPFNYKSAMKGEARPVYLRAGDTIIVP
jgi:polysaccharide export outer membrane protein